MRIKAATWFHANRVPLLLFGISLALRVYGNGFGLPDEFHIDETHLVPRAIRFGAGDLDPHWYFYPPLYMYLLFALYAAYFVIGRVTGVFGGAADFGMQYFLDPTMFYLIGRTATAVLGAATVWLVYRIGERAWGRAAGAAAAALLALNALHVENSHYITTDVPMTFFVTLGLWYALAYTRGGRARDLAAAGFAVGLAMATKYPGVLAVVIPALAVGVRWRLRGDEPGYVNNPDLGSPGRAVRGLVLSGACAAAGFVLGCPWVVLRTHAFYTDVTSQGETIKHAWLGMEGIRNMWWHVPSVFLRQGMTLPVLLVCVAGLVWALRRRRGADVIVAGFAILFYLWVAHYKNFGIARYWVAVLPALCLLGGRLIADAAARITPRHTLQIAGVLALVLSCASGWRALAAGRDMTLISTRTMAREWFCDNTPPGARVAVELHGPMLRPTRDALLRDAANPGVLPGEHVDQTTSFNYIDKQNRPWAKTSVTNKKHHLAALKRIQCKFDVFGAFSLAEYPLSAYRANGFEYLAVNQYMYERYLAASSKYPRAVAFYRALDRDCPPAPALAPAPCELVVEFRAMPGRITGPEIKIYRLIPAH